MTKSVIIEKPMVVGRELAQMPKAPRAGDVLHRFVFGVVTEQLASHSVQANRFEITQRTDAEHAVKGILQCAVADVQMVAQL